MDKPESEGEITVRECWFCGRDMISGVVIPLIDDFGLNLHSGCAKKFARMVMATAKACEQNERDELRIMFYGDNNDEED
jgi:hypothetical protein